jgi:hypothetical protein
MNNDIIGKNFGLLTVTQKSSEKKNGKYLYLCKCKCGNSVKVRKSSLVCKDTQSCGCLRTNKYIGRKFGRLTIIGLIPKSRNLGYGKEYVYKCDCGNTVVRPYESKLRICGSECKFHRRKGSVPFGFEAVSGRLVIIPEEQKILKLIKDLREKDGFSYNQIADELNIQMIPTKRKFDYNTYIEWHGKTVYSIYNIVIPKFGVHI